MKYGITITKDDGLAVVRLSDGDYVAFGFDSIEEAKDFCDICEAWDDVLND